MLYALLLIFSGVITGFLINKKKKTIEIPAKLMLFVIYFLIFFLGISIGKNETLIKSFFKIGLESIFITLAGISGSLIFALILEKFFFEEK